MAVEEDPVYVSINHSSRRDSPGLFEKAQEAALDFTEHGPRFLAHYCQNPIKGSLTRVACAMLLDPFLDGYVDQEVNRLQDQQFPPTILTLPWALVINISFHI